MKYPKLWNGTSAVGEALVRSLQRIRAPFLSAHTADGVIAGKMGHRLSEVKQEKDDEFIAVTWYAWSDSVITTPPPYEYYNVYTGIRSYDLEPSDLPDGYYLRSTHQYLGPLVISGGSPVMDPVPYSYSVVSDGFNPGYYATATGEWFGKLVWVGTGHRLYKWAIVNATKLNIVQRGVYEEDPLNLGRPRPLVDIAAKDGAVYTRREPRASGNTGSLTGQSVLHRMKALAVGDFAAAVTFPLNYESHWVVQHKWFAGKWWLVTQNGTVGTDSRLYSMDGDILEFVDLQSDYSFTLSAGKQGLVVGGWDGAGNYILELYSLDRNLLSTRLLGGTALFHGVDSTKRYVFANTENNAGKFHVQRFSLSDLLENPTATASPPEAVIEVGGKDAEGEDVVGGFYVAQRGIACAARRVFVLHTGTFYSPVDGSRQTGDVFLEVRSSDASTFKKSIKLDFASDENRYPSGNSGAICAMRE